MSLRVLRSWLGSSSFSVTAWERRSKRCLRFSSSSCLRCSVSFSRISLTFIVTVLRVLGSGFSHTSGDGVAALDESCLDRELVGETGQALLGGEVIDAGDFEHDGAGLDD